MSIKGSWNLKEVKGGLMWGLRRTSLKKVGSWWEVWRRLGGRGWRRDCSIPKCVPGYWLLRKWCKPISSLALPVPVAKPCTRTLGLLSATSHHHSKPGVTRGPAVVSKYSLHPSAICTGPAPWSLNHHSWHALSSRDVCKCNTLYS